MKLLQKHTCVQTAYYGSLRHGGNYDPRHRAKNLLIRALIVYVRPVIEDNSIIWSFHSICDIDLIEKVQRRFTKQSASDISSY